MIFWKEDCTLYKVINNSSIDITGLTADTFESYEFEQIYDNNIAINYNWVDPIRMKDKIVAREQRGVTFWYFLNEKILCCFSNSESDINYAVTKFSRKSGLIIEKIQIFDNWKKLFLSEGIFFAQLIGVHLKKIPTALDQKEIKKVSAKELKMDQIKEYLTSGKLTNSTFLFQCCVFYIDLASVLSFPDTVKEEDIYEVTNNLVKDLHLI